MAESKLETMCREFCDAWHARKRLFNLLENPHLPDDERAQAIEDYKAASKTFDELKTKLSSK